ncbi:MAG: dethiobiotin synthase [Deltaproteobacteria bacterium]|nr:dethiobiotin synthase [Deltaproteobacteria bacterium]
MSRAYFITGTDTWVGKTFVTSLLARIFREKGVDVGVMKPVETGCPQKDGSLIPQDAIKLKDASGSADPLDTINPYRFKEPLAPDIASEIAGVRIDFMRIKECYRKISGAHGLTLVEGAGGLLVPLTPDKTVADLILFLGLPLIVVGASRLGAVNHTLLTVECAKKRGIEVKGIILNNASPLEGDLSRGFNRKEIEKFTKIPVFGEVPYTESSLRDADLNYLKSCLDLERV